MSKLIKRYVKKPVEIVAVQFDGSVECIDALVEMGLDYARIDVQHLVISTLEGNMIANIGDYIIKGVNGEFYPCKPDIFAKTYDEVKK